MGDNEKFVSLETVKQDVKNAQQEAEHITETKQLVVFRLGKDDYALSIDQVKEVVPTPQMARVPHAPNYIRGVANIRGAITAIVDLKLKFGVEVEDDKLSSDAYTLVIEDDKYKAGVLVNEVPTTITINVDDIDDSKEILQYSGANQQYIVGIAKADNRMILLIDMIAMMTTDNVSELPEV